MVPEPLDSHMQENEVQTFPHRSTKPWINVDNRLECKS